MWLSLWREDGFVSYEYVCPFAKCTYSTYSVLWEILPCTLHTSSLSLQALQSRSYLSYVPYATTAAYSWTVVSLTAAKFKPLIFSTSVFALSYSANIFILMILYDFYLSAASSLVSEETSTEPIPSNGSCTIACLHSCYLTFDRWTLYWKGFRGKRLWFSRYIIPEFAWKDWVKPPGTWVRVTDAPSEHKSKALPLRWSVQFQNVPGEL
jgi:hypothetical protein